MLAKFYFKPKHDACEKLSLFYCEKDNLLPPIEQTYSNYIHFNHSELCWEQNILKVSCFILLQQQQKKQKKKENSEPDQSEPATKKKERKKKADVGNKLQEPKGKKLKEKEQVLINSSNLVPHSHLS